MSDFKQARDFLLAHREDYDAARAGFRWPRPKTFNWALEWFDAELAESAGTRDRMALRVFDAPSGTEQTRTFGELSRRSSQLANHLRRLGLKRGDHLLVVLGNVPALWETTLAAIKLGLVVIPATTLLTAEELADRIERGRARAIVAAADQLAKCRPHAGPRVSLIATDGAATGDFLPFDAAFSEDAAFQPDGPTGADDPMLLYFTSGTTAKPKLVRHSHSSYPIGALSTMYWLGLKPGDVHLNVSSPGWAKHAWSSLFAPWNAGATVLMVNQPSFSAKALLSAIETCGATTLCAPPTVWRLLIREDLKAHRTVLREVCGAGEPLNPEVIDVVREAWGLTIRDGYGQTETTAMAGNAPGQQVKAGSMGKPMPGYDVRILDADGQPAREGEISIALAERPVGLMQGYQDADGSVRGADSDFYRTGDVAFADEDGYLTFVGRADDVFKSNDYRISPFELESVLIEHEAVVEAAVIPAADAIRLSVPKAYVTLGGSFAPDRATALSIFRYTSERLAPFKRVRQVEFVKELPKTISGKIRRVQLRRLEQEGNTGDAYRGVAFSESDFEELTAGRKRES